MKTLRTRVAMRRKNAENVFARFFETVTTADFRLSNFD